jgi:hypothetical protein
MFHCNAIFSCATGKRAQLTARNDEKVPISVKNSRCISPMRFRVNINLNIEWNYSSFSLFDINVYHLIKTNYFVFGFFKRGNG